MRLLLALLLLLVASCVSAHAQAAPLVGTTLRTTSTAPGSVKVGCTQIGACTGGLTAGAIDVASVTSAGFIEIANNVPGSQTFRLVNNAGTLQWNGIALATGSSLSGTTGKLAKFTAANAVGDSICTEAGTTLTCVNTLAATTLTGTLSTASQPNITGVGTITTGVWSGTIIGLSKGGTGADLSGTGGASQFLRQNTLGGTVTVVRPAVADLSDASNIALLNASNTFTVASGQQLLVPSTTTNAAYWQFQNTGGSSIVGSDSSAGALGSGSAYSLLLLGGTAGGIALRANNGSGAIRMYTGGGNLRWGVNAAGDWTFGTSGNIADSSGTPTSAGADGCNGAGASISGADYAMKLATTTAAGTSCTINFGHTWTNTPVCHATARANAALNAGTFVNTVSPTQIVIVYPSSSNTAIDVTCRSF